MSRECTMVEITPVNALLIIFVPSTALMVLSVICVSLRKHCRKCLLCLVGEGVGEECGLGCAAEVCGIEPERTGDESGPKVITRVTDMINETSPGESITSYTLLRQLLLLVFYALNFRRT